VEPALRAAELRPRLDVADAAGGAAGLRRGSAHRPRDRRLDGRARLDRRRDLVSTRCRSAARGRCSETFITLNLSFLVFTFGSLLVAIQVAGGQYTPRIIATTLLRDNVIRTMVGVFPRHAGLRGAGAARMNETVNQLDVFVVASLGVVSVMAFLFLIDYAARSAASR
jgi:hypothetical protein